MWKYSYFTGHLVQNVEVHACRRFAGGGPSDMGVIMQIKKGDSRKTNPFEFRPSKSNASPNVNLGLPTSSSKINDHKTLIFHQINTLKVNNSHFFLALIASIHGKASVPTIVDDVNTS